METAMTQENAIVPPIREEKTNQRQYARHIVLLRLVRLKQRATRQFDAHISEISVYGCRIFTKAKLAVDDEISLCLSGEQMIDAHVIWREGEGAGCLFRVPIGMDVISQLAFDVG
jgi:PilZ domain